MWNTIYGLGVLSLFLALLGFTGFTAHAQPLRVCATVPELGSLVREVGGEQVSVFVFAKGTEDPHFVEAKPSFIKALSEADLYIQMGLDLEIGWAPVLLQSARNGKVLPGAPGYVDASIVISPREVPTIRIDRSMGDIHPFGNSHYLLDPINGLRVAELIQNKLIELRSSQREYFVDRYQSFRQKLGTAMAGETLAKKYDFTKLAILAEHGQLEAFLKSQGEESLLGGWLGLMLPYYGVKVVDDHTTWPYFADRFGVRVVGHLEPLPGYPPTTSHLRGLIERMRAEKIGVVMAAAYYDPRHARFVAENTSATVVNMANQVGARAGTDDYISMMDYNVRQLAAALGRSA